MTTRSNSTVLRRASHVIVGWYDARIYTDDKVKLPRALDRDIAAFLFPPG